MVDANKKLGRSLQKLIKEEQEWFDWDVDQRFNDLYAQVLLRDMSDVNCVQDVYHNAELPA